MSARRWFAFAAAVGFGGCGATHALIPFSQSGFEEVESTKRYMVRLVEKSTGKVLCSGIALSPRWVLTAGHCVNTGDPCAGTKCRARPAATTTMLAFSIHPHPDYMSGEAGQRDFQHDLALLHTRDGSLPARWTGSREMTSQVQAGDKLVSLGWGLSQPGSDRRLRHSHQMAFTFPPTPCATAMPPQVITSDELCGGFDDGAPCVFDSGGPVFTAGGTHDVPELRALVGVTSQAQDPSCSNSDWAIFAGFEQSDLEWIDRLVNGPQPPD